MQQVPRPLRHGSPFGDRMMMVSSTDSYARYDDWPMKDSHNSKGTTSASFKRKGYDSASPPDEPDLKRARPSDTDFSESEPDGDANPYDVRNFRISDSVVHKLKSKGIESLFPIQALTFDAIVEGNDLVGRARTGQGKTLAFVLPILESLTKSDTWLGQRRQYGKAPSVLVLVPTRELAKQVHADFEFYGSAVGLSTVCVYGGAPYQPQEQALRRGVDVVVGTPGRIKDHLEKGMLILKTLKFRVLDEADEMLNMGFVEDVEKILSYVEHTSSVQTLLFSATMPEWVKKIASKFLKEGKDIVDLVGDEKMKACTSVRHLVLCCVWSARSQLISDVINCYSSAGRCIVFTETKNAASELASILPGTARALHGDISQSQREATLAGFRSGKFSILVATDVAARGLDITDVQLIIQCEPPRDVETYIHRSGRTGRAGKTGISVMFYDRKKEYMIPLIERKAGFKFERISAPQPADLARAAATSAAASINGVSDSVLSIFRPVAEELMQDVDLPPVDIIAKAIAKIAGFTEVSRRSLITGQDDFATLMLKTSRQIYTPSYAFTCLKRVLPEDIVNQLKGMSLTIDGLGAVFDVPSKYTELFLAAQANPSWLRDGLTIAILEKLPELQPRPDHSNQGRGSGYNGRGGSRGGRGGSSNFHTSGAGRGGFNMNGSIRGGFSNIGGSYGGGFGNVNGAGPWLGARGGGRSQGGRGRGVRW